MASRPEFRGPRRVHFQKETDPPQREVLDRKAAEQRVRNASRVASDALASSARPSSQRAAVGTGRQTPLHQATPLSNGVIPVPPPIHPATPLRSLGPPQRVPIKQPTQREPTRARPGERR